MEKGRSRHWSRLWNLHPAKDAKQGVNLWIPGTLPQWSWPGGRYQHYKMGSIRRVLVRGGIRNQSQTCMRCKPKWYKNNFNYSERQGVGVKICLLPFHQPGSTAANGGKQRLSELHDCVSWNHFFVVLAQWCSGYHGHLVLWSVAFCAPARSLYVIAGYSGFHPQSQHNNLPLNGACLLWDGLLTCPGWRPHSLMVCSTTMSKGSCTSR